MTRRKKSESVPSRLAALQNRIINFQEEEQERNPPDIEALQQMRNHNRLVLEVNRWRARVANLEDENRALRRRIAEEERRRDEEARNNINMLQILFVYSLIIFINNIFKYFEIL